jgi:hypothetical protein
MVDVIAKTGLPSKRQMGRVSGIVTETFTARMGRRSNYLMARASGSAMVTIIGMAGLPSKGQMGRVSGIVTGTFIATTARPLNGLTGEGSGTWTARKFPNKT